MGAFNVFLIVQMVPNRTMHHIQNSLETETDRFPSEFLFNKVATLKSIKRFHATGLFLYHGVHWGINLPQNTTPIFLAKTP